MIKKFLMCMCCICVFVFVSYISHDIKKFALFSLSAASRYQCDLCADLACSRAATGTMLTSSDWYSSMIYIQYTTNTSTMKEECAHIQK